MAGNLALQDGAKDINYPILFKIYLIKCENRLMLVDAGCEAMPDFDMKDFIGPVRALKNMGIIPDDITDVLITHSHHDHIECIKYFKNATVYIQKDEYEMGKDYLFDNSPIVLFDDEIKVCENVTMQRVGGHSKGSCIVEINSDGEKYIIAGDECYLRVSLEKQIPTGCSYSPIKSLEFIKKYSGFEYKILLCHDN